MAKKFIRILAIVVCFALGEGCAKNHEEVLVSSQSIAVNTDLIEVALPVPLRSSLPVRELDIELSERYEMVMSPNPMIRINERPILILA